METKNNAIRDARTLGIPKMLLLGLQHMFAMFGATILVPILVNNYFKGEGLSIQVTLFLRRCRHTFLPFVYEIESSRFSWFFIRLSRRI